MSEDLSKKLKRRYRVERENVDMDNNKKRELLITTTNLMLLGETGVGKSAVCNLICKHLGIRCDGRFVESNEAYGCTRMSVDAADDKFRVIDNPGLLDPKGITEDRENICTIVTFAKDLGYVNGVLILINSKQPRLTDGIQNAIKLYVDSFGNEILSRMALLFTRFSFHDDNIRKLDVLTKQYRELISKRCNYEVKNMPYFYIDCHPEELAKDEVPKTRIEVVVEKTKIQIDDMLRWVIPLRPFLTESAVVGKYEMDELLEKEKEKNVNSHLIISTDVQTRTEKGNQKVTPIWKVVQGEREVTTPECHFSFGTGGVGIGFESKCRTIHYSETKRVGEKIEWVQRELQRDVVAYADGKVSYGDWKIVKETHEETVKEF